MSHLARALLDLHAEQAMRRALIAVCRRHPQQRQFHSARLADVEVALRLHAMVLIGAGL